MTVQNEIARLDLLSKTPDTLFTTEIQLDASVKNTIIKNIKNGGDKQNHMSNVKACMTDWEMMAEPGFDKLAYEIKQRVMHISYNLLLAPPPPNTDFKMRHMWGVLYNKGDWTKVHNHWPFIWSGVFYLQIPKDYSGALVFPELEHHYEPQTDQLIIFNGYTMHGVNTIKSSSERIIVSFNMQPEPAEGRWSDAASRV